MQTVRFQACSELKPHNQFRKPTFRGNNSLSLTKYAAIASNIMNRMIHKLKPPTKIKIRKGSNLRRHLTGMYSSRHIEAYCLTAECQLKKKILRSRDDMETVCLC